MQNQNTTASEVKLTALCFNEHVEIRGGTGTPEQQAMNELVAKVRAAMLMLAHAL